MLFVFLFFRVCGKLDTSLVEQRNSRYDMRTRPRLQAETHAGVFMLGRVFVCQPSNQSDPLQTDISPTNPPPQLCKYCRVTVSVKLLDLNIHSDVSQRAVGEKKDVTV